MRYANDDGSRQDDSVSSNVVKKPNPRNADSLAKIEECQAHLQRYHPRYLILNYYYQMTKLCCCCCLRVPIIFCPLYFIFFILLIAGPRDNLSVHVADVSPVVQD